MLFNSFEFILVFMPITIAVFIILQNFQRKDWSIMWLVFASLVFYAWWRLDYVGILVASICINYLISLFIANRPTEAVGARPRRALQRVFGSGAPRRSVSGTTASERSSKFENGRTSPPGEDDPRSTGPR